MVIISGKLLSGKVKSLFSSLSEHGAICLPVGDTSIFHNVTDNHNTEANMYGRGMDVHSSRYS